MWSLFVARGELLGRLVWMVLGVLAVLFLFWFVLIARELTIEAREAISFLSSFVLVLCFFVRALYSCWLE